MIKSLLKLALIKQILNAFCLVYTCLLLILLGAICSESAQAQDATKVFSVNFESSTEIQDLVSNLILDQSDISSPPVSLVTRKLVSKHLGENLWEAQVYLSEQDYQKKPKLYLSGIGKDGSIFVTPVVDITRAIDITSDGSVYCGDSVADLNSLSAESLALLIEIRRSKAIILREKLGRLLNEKAINELTRKEEALGLNYRRELSKEIGLSELAYRLTAIQSLK